MCRRRRGRDREPSGVERDRRLPEQRRIGTCRVFEHCAAQQFEKDVRAAGERSFQRGAAARGVGRRLTTLLLTT
jgi:hypothetical protein